jgi:membrane dipeptidase
MLFSPAGHKAIDLHCDSVYSLAAGKDLRQENPGVHVDIPRLVKGGVGVQVFAAFIPPAIPAPEAFAFAAGRLDLIDAFARSDPRVTPVETAGDCTASMAAGKTGILAAVENGSAIENSLEKLEALRRRKVRIMTLVHSQHLDWVASCTGEGTFHTDVKSKNPKGGGLTSFGEKVIDAMNGLGIIPDVSHSSENAFWDILGRSKKPVIASHSCAWALCAAARNLKDDQLKALGDTGGLAGVNFFSAFLSEPFRRVHEENCSDINAKEAEIGRRFRNTPCDDPEYRSARAEIDRLLAERLAPVPVPFSLIADHIDYMVKLAGEDSVGLGSDFDGIFAAPETVSGCDIFPRLVTELKSRGYTDEGIEKIFQGNFLRILAEWDK